MSPQKSPSSCHRAGSSYRRRGGPRRDSTFFSGIYEVNNRQTSSACTVCGVWSSGTDGRVRDRRPLHGTARLLPASACTPVVVGGSAGLAAYGPRSPDPPTLATRGSLPNGAWEPRLQTAPQEPKSPCAGLSHKKQASKQAQACLRTKTSQVVNSQSSLLLL